MYNGEKRVTIEWVEREEGKEEEKLTTTNPIKYCSYNRNDRISIMIAKTLQEEFPMIKDNTLLYNLVLYSLSEKLKTLQNVENALQYMKDNNAKKVHDVCIKNGEIHIKCSV